MSRRRSRETVRRFTPTEIAFHWAMVLPYLVLLVTGAILFAERIVSLEVLSKETLIDVHRIAGIALPACLVLTFLIGDRRVILRNLRLGTRFTRDDLEWLKHTPLQRFRPDLELPPMGKFNAGQKINFTIQVVAIPLFFVSGMLMWFVHGQLMPWYVHVALFLLVTPLIAGHMYLALANRSTRTSITSVIHGRVDAAWARHHHPLEYGDAASVHGEERAA